jgi:hypothetical protein
VWARRERREKRAERVAGGKNLITSLGIPSGPGALLVPNELMVAGYHVGEGERGVPAGFDCEVVGVVWEFPWGDGLVVWCGAAEFGGEVRVYRL